MAPTASRPRLLLITPPDPGVSLTGLLRPWLDRDWPPGRVVVLLRQPGAPLAHRLGGYDSVADAALRRGIGMGLRLDWADFDEPAATASTLALLAQRSAAPTLLHLGGPGWRDDAELLARLRAAGPWQLSMPWHAGEPLPARGAADVLLASPVLPTRSKPGARPLGWDGLGRMVRAADRPVLALGGLGSDSLATAIAVGAQGVAAISAAWREAPQAWADALGLGPERASP